MIYTVGQQVQTVNAIGENNENATFQHLLLINWALALGSTYVTVVVVVRRDKVHDGVLLLPVTIILTIPTLRGLFVGSPPFGIYLGRS